MTRLIVYIMLILTCCHHVAAQGSSSVEWGRPVAFADFESAPGKADTAAANISVTILLGYVPAPDGFLRYKVVAVMDKNESWIRKEFRTVGILRHEQGHFDIAHIFAKKLEANLKTKRFTSKDEGKLNALYDQYLDMMNNLQLRYDRETKGGHDPLGQSKWRNYIRSELGKIMTNNE